MAPVVEPPQHRRVHACALFALWSAALFPFGLVGFLLVRAIICQGSDENLGNLTWLCPLVDALVSLLAISVPVALVVIGFQLYSLGTAGEKNELSEARDVSANAEHLRAEAHERRAAEEGKEAAFGDLAAAISFAAAGNILRDESADAARVAGRVLMRPMRRIAKGQRMLHPQPRRHFRNAKIAFSVIAIAYGTLWWQWGWRGIIGMAPKLDPAATFKLPPLPAAISRPASEKPPG